MNIWLITIGEPLPIDPGSERLLRTGLLAESLARSQHRVTWWTSSFNHWIKKHRFAADQTCQLASNYKISLIRARGYGTNVSPARLIDHWQLARKFRAQSRVVGERPDLILCSFPSIELSLEAVRYGEEMNVPVVLDVRDLWPDIFINLAPAPARGLSRAILSPYFKLTRKAMSGATSILAINEPFVRWGLTYAGRAAGPYDRAFSMGYPSRAPSMTDQQKARDFWRAHGLEDDRFTAIFAGTIGRQFQFEPIIEAAAMLPDVRFVICGTGDRLEHVQSSASGLSNIIFTGWIGAAEIWVLMRLAHVGLAPYHDEKSFTHSLPNKSLEYLSAGLPLVSSLPGALAKLLNDNNCGITYPNLDSQALCSALSTLRDNPPQRDRMARNAMALFEESFTAEAIYGRMIAHLEMIAAAGHRSSSLQAD